MDSDRGVCVCSIEMNTHNRILFDALSFVTGDYSVVRDQFGSNVGGTQVSEFSMKLYEFL